MLPDSIPIGVWRTDSVSIRADCIGIPCSAARDCINSLPGGTGDAAGRSALAPDGFTEPPDSPLVSAILTGFVGLGAGECRADISAAPIVGSEMIYL